MGHDIVKDLQLPKLLKDKFINLELKGNDKSEIIAELVELLSKSKKIVNKKAFLRAILEREKLGSTGIGNGVAIPHAKSKYAKGFILAFARRDEGIDFGALDGEKTYLFFTLASPEEEVGGHLKILAEISRLMKDKFIVELLKKAKNQKEILKVLADIKSSSHF
jgi:fructose-specific phosphotransferase system IIA component